MPDNPLLQALGELVRTEISGRRLLQRLVDVMATALEADRGTIFFLDEEKEELVSVAAHLPEMDEIRVPLNTGLAGYVAREGRIVNIPFCETDPRFWSRMDEKTGYRTRTMLAGPLRDRRGDLFGVAQFLNKRDGIFTDSDEEMFRTLSQQAAGLLEETTLGRGAAILNTGGSEPFAVGDRINRIVGHGEAMGEVFRAIRRVAPTEATVLLRGESGTGKGLVAKAIHHNSNRGAHPFVHLDCTTLPGGLMENELFGHERGAYTGAHARKEGKVEAASGGTLFLDEIGDLPSGLQSKLLTLLQDRTFSRVGGTDRLEADIRIVAATNRDLEGLVREGRFREDLYYRLRVVQIELPPLRERGRADLVRLIDHFMALATKHHDRPVSGIRPDALDLLLNYSWPGNVRELENCIESAVIFADEEITLSDLALPGLHDEEAGAGSPSPPADGHPFADRPSLEELEARYIAHLLEELDNNRSETARQLGIGRNTLLRKIRKYGLE